ncbi:MAG: hypothetical protein IJX24_02390 [Oscillospiraceae bacterium]|nr:hypothetical protein [Oscillospiraceae bacterium]
MENYRNKLKIHNIIFAVSAIALITAFVLAGMRVIKPVEGDSYWMDYWNGLIAGMSVAVMGFMIFGFIKNLIALKNTEKLRKQYLKENDERTIQITRYGQATGASIFLLMLPAAIIISGYFNPTVCITCLVVTFGLSLSMALGKIIYSKKM